jgi:hypothetical protein
MKNSLIYRMTALAVLVAAVGILGSCRKNTGTTDLVIVPPIVPGVRQLSVSVLNSSNKDSLTGYTLSLKTPSALIETTVAGKKFVVDNPVAGTYTLTASLNGFIANSKTFSVVLPAQITASLYVDESIQLTKTAPVVVVTTTAPATVTVKQVAEVPASPVVAVLTVPAATVFTLPDNSKPVTVNISVTNIPTPAQSVPTVVVANVSEKQAAPVQVVIGDKLPMKILDLQPSGLTFDKPMVIELSIADCYPKAMTIAEKIAKQADLSLNYVRKDNTVEKVAPDHFSADRNTVYFQITHFSQWFMTNNKVTVTKIGSSLSPVQEKTAGCGEALAGSFVYTLRIKYLDPADPYLPWLLSNEEIDLVYTVSESFAVDPLPGYSTKATWQCDLVNYRVVDTTPGGRSRDVAVPQSGRQVVVQRIICHNQGGGK